jgi:hypothetical protein
MGRWPLGRCHGGLAVVAAAGGDRDGGAGGVPSGDHLPRSAGVLDGLCVHRGAPGREMCPV